jgi:hypothetical protein
MRLLLPAAIVSLFLTGGASVTAAENPNELPGRSAINKDNRAMSFMEAKAKEAGWPGFIQNTDPFHPSMMLKISAPGNAVDYLRT